MKKTAPTSEDKELCKKIDKYMEELRKRVEKETGCKIEGMAICFTGKGKVDQISIHSGVYSELNVMEGKINNWDINYLEQEQEEEE